MYNTCLLCQTHYYAFLRGVGEQGRNSTCDISFFHSLTNTFTQFQYIADVQYCTITALFFHLVYPIVHSKYRQDLCCGSAVADPT